MASELNHKRQNGSNGFTVPHATRPYVRWWYPAAASMAPGGTPGTSKHDAIVRAATRLFQRYGYRRTTVELIAQEAGVAKPTLYAHFEDKDAIFVAVCKAVVARIVDGARAAAQLPDPIERVVAMLSAKFTTVYELVDASPHARELLESSDARAREIIEDGDRIFVELMTSTLKAAARAGELSLDRFGGKPAVLTQLLMQAGHGAGWGASTVEQQRRQLDALVRAMIERAPAPTVARAGRATARRR
ncbi:MAG: TetR/AcrR family transcriptional regulator [Deltaproteobacteria bacterium]|nr:TetR/AcrR family transcriptional regulator [Deltaproteobacteria bacterium]MBK8716456.1 TetR/AcrR family transcriptional regulator [Deltaproteobacteria bacterium]MBP7287355.1 TetR/AcrR family transcriptional regulator [Nannocystaceae bacterium]